MNGRETRTALAFLAPSLCVIVVLLAYPLARTLVLSLYRYNLAQVLGKPARFVGLENYRDLATSPFFWHVVLATLAFAGTCVVGTLAVGTIVALALEDAFPGRSALRVVVALPWAMPAVAASIVWKWLFDDQHGPLDAFLSALGLHAFAGFSWTANALVAFAAVAVIVAWQTFPFVTITLLAGFATLPRSVYEAAAVDGISDWRRTCAITLPMLGPLFLTLIVLLMIWDVKVFTQMYVMTGGGPGRGTYVLGLYAWREGFASVHLGVAAAIAAAMSALLAIFVGAYVRLARGSTA